MSCLCCHYAWLPPGAVSAFCSSWGWGMGQGAGGPMGVIINLERGFVCGCVFGDSSWALIFSPDPPSKPTHWAPQDKPRATGKSESLCPMDVRNQTHACRVVTQALTCTGTDVNVKTKNAKTHFYYMTTRRRRGLHSHSHTQPQRSVVWELRARQEHQSIARIWGSETSPFAGCQAPLANTEQQPTALLKSVQWF